MSKQETQSVLDLLADLVRINSVNPNYEGGVPEVAMADFVERYFANRGIETWRQPVYQDRPNVIARIPGRDSSRRIVFEAHMDTVSVAGMTIDPWEPEIREGRMYGRGSCDTKGGMAAMMHAAAGLVADNITPPCDVLFAATIDEEYSYRGVVAFCAAMQADGTPLQADAAIVAEPTELQPVIASKGLVRWKIETIGTAAHSAKPHLGVNAIENMARVIAVLEQDTLRMSAERHPLLGAATCNVGVIRGGVQINFVPDRCEIEIDRRLLPGETPESALAHYQMLLDELAASEPQLKVVMHPPMLTDVPLETDADSAAVQTMQRVLGDLGLDATAIGVPFCSDASKFGAQGIPSMILGPGSIDQAHAAVEYIDCQQVERAAEVYRNFMIAFE
ncbi:M20 family metallopeptidase [Roseimaritima ulvae]|uniref:Probable succinyl-diaminopimelate desuccinylase n=1 Tax=Roseimaritima ulvae TaxID=980254 RepID=A0A5B9QJE1_9BACT|nr:M20 family metallopeptidase [Roseimaritima ulvae]QEG39168.1 Acetylornithine deacetylase [Roseimaritima ulvae]